MPDPETGSGSRKCCTADICGMRFFEEQVRKLKAFVSGATLCLCRPRDGVWEQKKVAPHPPAIPLSSVVVYNEGSQRYVLSRTAAEEAMIEVKIAAIRVSLVSPIALSFSSN